MSKCFGCTHGWPTVSRATTVASCADTPQFNPHTCTNNSALEHYQYPAAVRYLTTQAFSAVGVGTDAVVAAHIAVLDDAFLDQFEALVMLLLDDRNSVRVIVSEDATTAFVDEHVKRAYRRRLPPV